MKTLFERIKNNVMNHPHTIREREKFKLFEMLLQEEKDARHIR